MSADENKNTTLCAGCVVVPSSGQGKRLKSSKSKSKSKKAQSQRSSCEENLDRITPDLGSDDAVMMSDSESGSGPAAVGVTGHQGQSEDSHQCTFESCDEDSVADYAEAKLKPSPSFIALR